MFWVLVWLTDCLIDCKAPKKTKKKVHGLFECEKCGV